MFCDEDIDSAEEFTEFFSIFRSRLLEIAKIIAIAVPSEVQLAAAAFNPA